MEVVFLHLSILLNLGETLLPINKNKYYQNNYSRQQGESSAWRWSLSLSLSPSLFSNGLIVHSHSAFLHDHSITDYLDAHYIRGVSTCYNKNHQCSVQGISHAVENESVSLHHQSPWTKQRHPLSIAHITVEPAVKYSFAEKGMQTKRTSQYKAVTEFPLLRRCGLVVG